MFLNTYHKLVLSYSLFLPKSKVMISTHYDVISLINEKCDISGGKCIDQTPIIMSLISTNTQQTSTNAQLTLSNDKQSSTIEQLMKKISQHEQNEKLLKQQLADN